MAGILIGLSLNVLIFFVLYAILRRRIDRGLSGDEVIDRLRDEVNGMVVELNRTSDRNIGIIEERIHRLQALVANADRRIQMLQRDADRYGINAQLYTNLKQQAAAMPPEAREAAAGSLETAAAAAPSGEAEAPTTAAEESGNAVRPAGGSAGDNTDAVLEMHRQGIEARLIASRLGASVGEVELIISLGGRHR